MPKVIANNYETYYELDDFTDPWKPAETIVIQHGLGRGIVNLSDTLALSQTLDEDEQNYHFLLPMRPRHKTAPPVFGARSLGFPVAPCESRASLQCRHSYSTPPKRT
jgi:hypothetical protein